MKRLLKGGRVINPVQNFDGLLDIMIENGRIVALGEKLAAADAEVYDATGKVICPGLIDMHVHLREPGQEAKEDMATCTRAAAAGGFTAIACMPNTRPAVDSSILVNGLLQRAAQEAVVRVFPIGAMTKGQEGKELAEIGDMIQAGAAAISDDGSYVNKAQVMMNGLEYTHMFDRVVIDHAEDESLAGDGFMHEGAVSAKLGLRGRPAVAEDIQVARDIMLAEYTGAAVHIAHMSTKGAVELVRQAKARGVKVTSEVTPHHLTLTDEAVIGFNTATKVNPPLRSGEHVAALREGLKDGTVDVVATDHAPHAFEEKDVEYRYAPSGFTGLETALGVLLTDLVETGAVPLATLIERMTVGPARVLRLNEAGEIAVGKWADITLIDLEQEWEVESRKFYTRGKATPFEGRRLKGRAVATMVAGEWVMKEGEICR